MVGSAKGLVLQTVLLISFIIELTYFRNFKVKIFSDAAVLVLLCSQVFVSSLRAQGYTNSHDVNPAQIKAWNLAQSLNSSLLEATSASKTLQSWCGDHDYIYSSGLRAEVIERSVDIHPETPKVRVILKASPAEPVAFRRVRLICGRHVLSDAENWYLPARLKEGMNWRLNNTSMPFGLVVQELGFYRRNQSVDLLWWNLQDPTLTQLSTDLQLQEALAIPDILFRHYAVLYSGEDRPFSYVVESYTKDLIAPLTF